MVQNVLPRVSEEELESGVFRIETDAGVVLERPDVARLDEIESFDLLWLWPRRIPQEKVTFLVGPADAGKSLLAVDLAARVSRGGGWPDCPDVAREGGEVLYVCDSPETLTAVGPRLERAGADRDNLHLFYSTLVDDGHDARPRARGLTFPDDFQHLVYAVEKLGARQLVIIDSLSEFCPDATRETRTVRLLHHLAAEFSVAIVVLSRGRGIRAGQGAIQEANGRAFAGARCVWSVGEDSADSGLRHFLPVRFGYGPRPGGLAFRIQNEQVVWEPAGALARRPPSKAVEEVMRWLEQLLHGQVLPSKLIQQEARECGFSSYTLRTARIELGVQIGKQGFNDGAYWCWSLGMQAGNACGEQDSCEAREPIQPRLAMDELDAN